MFSSFCLFSLVDREEAAEKFQEDDENKDGKITFEEIVHKQFGYTAEDLKDLKEGKEDEDKDVLEVPVRLLRLQYSPCTLTTSY